MAQPNLKAVAATAAQKYGIPVNVFERQIQQESGFNPNARSGAGAEGIAQFMPATARGFGLSNPFDPVAALDAAARYDSNLLHKYGSLAEALSAYNSGNPTAYKDPNFAKGQTYNYVKDILGGITPTSSSVPARTPMSVGAALAPSPGAAPTGNLLGQIMAQTNQMVGLGDSTNLAGLLANAALGTPKPKPGKPGQGQGGLTPRPIGGNGVYGLKFQGSTSGEQPGFLGELTKAAKAVGAQAIRINSGYRTPQHNAAVGGVQGSLHTRGLAMDGEALIRGQWVPLGVALKPVAPRFGLRSGAVPGFFNGKSDPVHVDAGYGVRS